MLCGYNMLYFHVKASQIPLKWQCKTYTTISLMTCLLKCQFNWSVGCLYYTPKSENVLITLIGLMLTKPLLSKWFTSASRNEAFCGLQRLKEVLFLYCLLLYIALLSLIKTWNFRKYSFSLNWFSNHLVIKVIWMNFVLSTVFVSC